MDVSPREIEGPETYCPVRDLGHDRLNVRWHFGSDYLSSVSQIP